MPAVAQISVNFATRFQIESNPSTLPTSVRCVTPRSLTEYLLNSRELGPTAITNTVHMNYSGGFITAGDKINVKHNDFQLRQNLDVERSLYVDSIYARRKGNTADSYQISRSEQSRKITLAPLEGDLTNTNSSNYIDISTSPSAKSITLFINHGSSLADKENSVNLFNDSGTKKLTIKTGNYVLSAIDIKNFGPIYNSSTVEIEGETTITDRLKITGNFDLGPSYNRFNINSSSGNVSFAGNLTINTDRFTVNSASGNTAIAGTLSVTGNTSIVGTTTLSNSLTFDNGNSTSSTRRVTGVRTVLNAAEIFSSSTYLSDALTINDFKTYYQSTNVGTGEGSIFKQRNSSGVMEFKKLKAGTNISIIDDGENITINNSSPLGLSVIGRNTTGGNLTNAQIRDIVQNVFPATSFSNNTICRVNVEYPSNATISGVTVSVGFKPEVTNTYGRSIGRTFLSGATWTGTGRQGVAGTLTSTGNVNNQPTFRVDSTLTKIFQILGGTWTYISG